MKHSLFCLCRFWWCEREESLSKNLKGSNDINLMSTLYNKLLCSKFLRFRSPPIKCSSRSQFNLILSRLCVYVSRFRHIFHTSSESEQVSPSSHFQRAKTCRFSMKFEFWFIDTTVYLSADNLSVEFMCKFYNLDHCFFRIESELNCTGGWPEWSPSWINEMENLRPLSENRHSSGTWTFNIIWLDFRVPYQRLLSKCFP